LSMLLAEAKSTFKQESASSFDFGRIADSYDKWYSTARGFVYDRLEKKAIDRLLPNGDNGSRLLEVGCGTGHWSEYFSNRGFEVTGVDISKEMIEVAKNKHIAKSQFQVADGENLPFADESFDLAVAVTTLEFTANPEKMVSEMARCVKKPAGKLIVGVLNALCSYNQKRKNKSHGVYSAANLLSPEQIKELLERFGKPQILIAGFVPQRSWLLWLSPLCEFAGHLISSQRGVFIAAKVDL
jgi:ubiquinone/menaquinone biosynthesis C-methylase UbiE